VSEFKSSKPIHGNARVGTAFLYGLAAEELPPEAFETVDPACPLLFCVRAQKPGA
jgi:hypothetical protein